MFSLFYVSITTFHFSYSYTEIVLQVIIVRSISCQKIFLPSYSCIIFRSDFWHDVPGSENFNVAEQKSWKFSHLIRGHLYMARQNVPFQGRDHRNDILRALNIPGEIYDDGVLRPLVPQNPYWIAHKDAADV